MQLALWTYEAPTHVGALRIATSMAGVHCVLHAPLGDSYADLLFTMVERRDQRPPVSYTSFQQRDLGRSTADLVKDAVRSAYERFRPEVLLVSESCTAELLQDQAGTLARTLGLPVPVLPLDLPSWSRKETWGASETFLRLVRALLKPRAPAPGAERPCREAGRRPRANLLGATALGFRCRDDLVEVTRLLDQVGVDVHVTAPLGARPRDLLRIPEADFNICLYPEVAETTCAWLERFFGQPWVRTVPIGVGATRDFLAEVGRVAGLDVSAALASGPSRLPWYSHSVDATYLTGKRVFIFADATHAIAAARIVAEELGMSVVGLGTYLREQARPVRAAAQAYGIEALISDDYLEVEARIGESQPELVLGTQMERHVAKRLGIPCAVISAPAHVQDFPARFTPQMGFAGADVIFDTWVHPLMMGLEEHLITMFRGDFEFREGTAPSHLGSPVTATAGQAPAPPAVAAPAPPAAAPGEVAPMPKSGPVWDTQAEQELKKIPFFVRGKARRNTERFAQERGLATISMETLYDAKAYFGR
ncbi:MAG: ferredoxin:protochlorophyllide reductase (ATP-dependent) subunit B [Chromatiaceae bacterium]|nr:ferredoxin:protochlorophyllide reductase (ATP-dependent) subunit B [Chromatiaceae bacterium]